MFIPCAVKYALCFYAGCQFYCAFFFTCAERSAPFIDLTPGFNNIQEAVNEYFSEGTIMDYECEV